MAFTPSVISRHAWYAGALSRRGPAVLAAAGVGSLALYAAVLALHWSGAAAALYHVPAVVGLVVTLRVLLRTSRLRERAGLAALAAMILSWDCADWVFSVSEVASGGPPAFPSLAEPLYYLGYAFALVALPMLTFPCHPRPSRRWIFDALIVSAAVGAITWEYLVWPRVDAMNADGLTALLALGYPVLDLGIMAAVVSVCCSAATRFGPRAATVLVALCVFVATDALYSAALISNTTDEAIRWLDLGWLIAAWLLPIALLLPAERSADASARPAPFFASRSFERALDVIPYLVAAPLLVITLFGARADGAGLALPVGATLVATLVIARQVLAVRENHSLADDLRAEGLRVAAAARSLQESEHFARTVIGSLNEGLVVLDRSKRFVAFNSFMEQHTGVVPHTVLGRIAPDVPELAALMPREPIDQALAGGVAAMATVRFPLPANRFALLDGRFAPLRSSTGETVGVVGIFDEVSERKRAEQAVAQAQRMESLGLFAAGVAHDFNNLLTTVLGGCSLLRMGPGDQEQQDESIDLIEQAAQRGAEISGRLVSFAQGRLNRVGALDLRDVVTDAVRLVRTALPDSLRLEVDLPGDAVVVEGDRTELQQVISTLLFNARDVLPDGGLVSIRALERDGDALVVVSDDGPGMDEATRLRVFEPFFTTKPFGTGTGLGLSAAYGIVQQHRGDLAVDSAPGHGATFTIRLPLAVAPALADHQAEAAARPGPILVVDDDAMIRRTMRATIARLGLESVEVAGGRAALECLAVAPDAFSCVLLDMVMPGMSGSEVFREIRAMRRTLPVIVCTGLIPDETDPEMARDVAAILPKPFSRAQLAGVLETVGITVLPDAA